MSQSVAAHRTLEANLAQFVGLLRANGFTVGPGEAATALSGLVEVDLLDWREVYLTLRATLVHRPEDYPRFQRLFAAFWRPAEERVAEVAPQTADEPALPGPLAERPGGAGPDRALAPSAADGADDGLAAGEAPGLPDLGSAPGRPLAHADDGDELGPDEPPLHDLYSAAEGVLTRDVGQADAAAAADLCRLAERLARLLATRVARRLRAARRGMRVDLRRSLRRSLPYGGEPLRLVRRRRRIDRARLVLLCDVSGSMAVYTRFLLTFVHALQAVLSQVESFVFATRLTRITPALRHSSDARVLARLPGVAAGWGGGTRTGQCLAEFNSGYGLRMLGPRTTVVILSDGIDTGPP
ncbi:MAG: VWA domain-containing protein [Firmicutes bacterium]|nr:VWA domain-containing protein [Bacillota bacterium]